MGEILPRHYITGIIIFTLFIVGGMSLLNIMRNEDPSFADDDKFTEFNDSFNVMDDLDTSLGSLQTQIETSDSPDQGIFGFLDTLISISWNALRTIFTSFSFMTTAYTGMSRVFGVPAWIPILIGLLVTTLFIFAIWSAIFQREL